MWLLPDSLRFLCSPDTEASTSVSDSPESTTMWWVTLSGKATQRPSSWQGWKRRPWIERLSGAATSKTFRLPHFSAWTSSTAASPASRGPLPASEVALTTTVGCGRRSPDWFGTWDRSSCSWRTSPDSTDDRTVEDLPSSSRILPTSGSMRNGACSPQPPLAHLTSGNGSGSWPTPTGTDSKASGGNPHTTGTHGVTLTDRAVRMWPTPRAHDGTSGGDKPSSHPKSGGIGLQTAARSHGRPTPTTTTVGNDGSQRADLNPRFVAALMGVPWDWLSPCTSVGTEQFRRWLHEHSCGSETDSKGEAA